MFTNFIQGREAFGVAIEILSCPIRNVTKASLASGEGCLTRGDDNNSKFRELIDSCRVKITPLFSPVTNLECPEKCFLVYCEVVKDFDKASFEAVTLGDFCNKWGEHLKKINGTEAYGYNPNYPNPRAMFLDKIIEAEENYNVIW